MAGKSAIEWTEQTWNPIVGCSIVSPGCTNCYAMKIAARIEAMSEAIYDRGKHTPPAQYCGTTKKVNGNAVWTGLLSRAPRETLLAPLRRKKPTTYFVNSMGDLFHEDCPDEWIDEVFAIMALCPQHTFQVLTKRAARMKRYLEPFSSRRSDNLGKLVLALGYDQPLELLPWPLPNVWLGVSAERQAEADLRIPDLLQTPAAVRFLSAEPLLGPIDLIGVLARFQDDPIAKRQCAVPLGMQLIDWVIVGGESGPSARPMHPAWAQSLRDQCAAAGVAFFFKQWGEHAPVALKDNFQIDRRRFYFNGHGFPFHQIEGYALVRVGKKNAGRKLDGVEHNAIPEISR